MGIDLKNTSVSICTYKRSLSGDGSKLIKKFSDQGFENFFVHFDNTNKCEIEDIKKSYNANICIYSEKDFEENNFNRPINKHHRWGSHQNPNYFYAHFRMLVFYMKNPNYEYYWFFDDDVDFEGNLKNLLSNYSNCEDDFLAIQAFKKENYENFPKISIINDKMKGSHGNWLSFCPGPGDVFKNTNIHIGSFFPIVRFSKNAMDYLLRLNNQNYYGYSEGFVPTSLASEGFKVSSMMDEFDNFFIKNNTNCVLFHKGIKFTWDWL